MFPISGEGTFNFAFFTNVKRHTRFVKTQNKRFVIGQQM